MEFAAVNYQCELSSKLFDFIQARLVVAVSLSHEVAGVVGLTSVGAMAEVSMGRLLMPLIGS